MKKNSKIQIINRKKKIKFQSKDKPRIKVKLNKMKKMIKKILKKLKKMIKM